MIKRLLLLALTTAALAQTPAPPVITAYSYTISSTLFAGTTDKPTTQPFQVILFKVTNLVQDASVMVVPQGTNVQMESMFFQLKNLPMDSNGWYRIVMTPIAIIPTDAMSLTAPQMSTITSTTTITQVN